MFLRALTLKGFKSFADATKLELEPGVTVVVGPNGSGKSNVVDAIAWVLGAQAPSAVRSQKMDDVIFAGSAKRPALGRAEVSLTIDNSAGLLPIDFTEVTVTRTLFRTGESEYALNGVPCRLLDVQELLSDAGVGRQQHVIVSQGQIDAVLSARPEERRAIIEEAAGVLKYRKRKERAERRLEGTEGNLLRLQDLLREVRRTLKPLERQADAARRHGDLVAELDSLRVFLAGREVAALRDRLDALAGERVRLSNSEIEIKASLAALDVDVMAAEARLGAMGAGDLGDELGRVEALRERARGLAAVLAERRRGLEADRGRLLDTGLVASLEAEGAQVALDLIEVERQAALQVPELETVMAADAELVAERAALEPLAEVVDVTASALAGSDLGLRRVAAEVRGELAAVRGAVARASAEVTRGESRLATLAASIIGLDEAVDAARGACEVAEAAEVPLVAEQQRAEVAVAGSDEALRAALAAQGRASAARGAAAARVDALALALDEARARAGAERLAAIDGVVGTLLDLVEVDDGWEAAFEAAAGDALAAVVVRDPAAGRAAIDALHREGAAAAVLALGVPLPASVALGSIDAAGSVRGHVRSRDRLVSQLLDALVGAAFAVDGGWAEAVAAAMDRPGAVVVTRDGDRFGVEGWRLGVARARATGAALDQARTDLERCEHDSALADAALTAAGNAQQSAQATLVEVANRLDANDATFAAAAEQLNRAQSERRQAVAERDQLAPELAEAAERLARERVGLADLEALLPVLEAAESADAEHERLRRATTARLDQRARALAAQRSELDVRAAALDERGQLLRRRAAEIDARLAADVVARAAAGERRRHVERALAICERLSAVVADRQGGVDRALEVLRERRRAQSEAARAATEQLDAHRRARAAGEAALEQLRERARRAEVDEVEVRTRLEGVVATLRHDLDVEPEVAVGTVAPELPEGISGPQRVRDLERELRIMGPINPLALEEFTALQERHSFLEAQLDDVRAGRRELLKVIKAVDDEIQSVFAGAYSDVARHFESLFATLFPGGQGRLTLTDPDNLLDTGIEVEARPSGKNVRKLSLLSGGERSLTALAFLFAVFRSRPSPFYVMDEVEAALDDVNLHRFLDLVAEFRDEAQLLIVSHQKRTMEAADCLFGVTMQPGGSSRVISEKL